MNANNGIDEDGKVRLTQLSNAAGCAAKLKATELIGILSSLPKVECGNLEVGFDGAEDALCYNLDDATSLVSTVDFFPAMVDDPFTFGEIAAANALSDIYAMGAKPLYALSLMCFPQRLDKRILREILEGGISKAKEAGIPIAGGHTIDDEVPKYGLCVTGSARRGRIWRNNGVRKGDCLVLTKTLGVGIINTAVKCREASPEAERKAIESMRKLNKLACETAFGFDVHAATDVTGFGLLGHMMEMIEGANSLLTASAGKKLSARIFSKEVPYFSESYELAEIGLLPAGLYNNRDYTKGKVRFDDDVPLPLQDIMFDPQTSGGLLLSMPLRDAEDYVKQMPGSKIIAEITSDCGSLIHVE